MALFVFGANMNNSSLHRQLVLPYVLLVILVAALIGGVSFNAGQEAVATLSQRVVNDIVYRIRVATEQHLAGALTALYAVTPDPRTVPRPQPFSDDLATLEPRIWSASGLFMEVNNYVYFGGEDGRFIGVNRINKDFVELYLREPGALKRDVYAVTEPGDRTRRLLRTDDYDPRKRPWYSLAAKQKTPVWSPVYNDYTSREPTITLAKSVFRADQTLAGVMATDVTLKVLTDFLRKLRVSEHGIAFVMDSEGVMIATSGNELPFRMVNGIPERMRLEEMRTPLLQQTHSVIHKWEDAGVQGDVYPADEFQATTDMVEIAASRLGRQYGVDWIAVVAVPHSDFLGGVKKSFIQGAFIAIVCVVIILVLGLSILNRILLDIRKLTDAAKKIGNGEPLPPLNISRRDEIGQLATTFSEMEYNLRIDELTGVFNRASLIAQIGFLRRQLEQRPEERPSFALLFIDLDHFKQINDQYGHDAGDKVLVTVASRLKESVRVYDVVARYGGDEFIVLLKGATNADEVMATEVKILRCVEEPVHIGGEQVKVGISIGWAMFPQDGEDVDTLLKIADQRMFDTKRKRKAASERPA